MRLRLHYVHLDAAVTAQHDIDISATELQQFFASSCTAYLTWRAALDAWRAARNAALKLTPFPFPGYRPGQRQLAAAAFRGHRDGTALICEAPTGLGKTAATLFPALQALAHGHADRVLYLTARGTGQAAALTTLQTLRAGGATLRQVQIIAKEKVCLTPGAACAAETCSYAAGHFDRAPAAIAALHEFTEVGMTQLQHIGRSHCVCPFELSLAAARWADVVICDYNYVLDPVIRSANVIAEGARRTSVLIDEAHQLPDRIREMYSATISWRSLRAVVKVAGKTTGRAADRLASTLKSLWRSARRSSDGDTIPGEAGVLIVDGEKFERELTVFLDQCTLEVAADSDPALTEAYFQAIAWRALDRIAQIAPYGVIAREQDDDIVLLRYCIDAAIPARLALKPFRSVQAFSGTLPGDQSLGLPGNPNWLRLGSPFPPEHLGVFVVRDLSVYFRDRERTVLRLAAMVRELCAARAGNYLVFVPSFVYADMLLAALLTTSSAPDRVLHGEPQQPLECFAQSRQMDDAQRSEFIARFAADGKPRLAVAVTGGVFSESVDLTGERLIGVIVVGIALPPRSLERELVRRACLERSASALHDADADADADADDDDDDDADTKCDDEDRARNEAAGDALAYQYPAMIRVLQTAGRLIRAASDRGVLCLVDARFTTPPYRTLLPEHWRPQTVPAARIGAAAAAFWKTIDAADMTERSVTTADAIHC